MKRAKQTSDTEYVIEGGGTMKREQGETPNGNELNAMWVLRDAEDIFIDFDQYRSELASRNNISIYRS